MFQYICKILTPFLCQSYGRTKIVQNSHKLEFVPDKTCIVELFYFALIFRMCLVQVCAFSAVPYFLRITPLFPLHNLYLKCYNQLKCHSMVCPLFLLHSSSIASVFLVPMLEWHKSTYLLSLAEWAQVYSGISQPVSSWHFFFF